MESFIVAAVTGVISSAATIAAIRVDIIWIKRIQWDLKERVESIEDRVSKLEGRS
ncbi:hypothetical protein [Vibrio splendidus]|uniref:hypothetical protein n=1 Tax=Vibrio splendidus TaxID=29497 RepID=UPI0018E48D42|nr:hypothetical protein [Vibrio splendidus]